MIFVVVIALKKLLHSTSARRTKCAREEALNNVVRGVACPDFECCMCTVPGPLARSLRIGMS